MNIMVIIISGINVRHSLWQKEENQVEGLQCILRLFFLFSFLVHYDVIARIEGRNT